MHISVYDNEDIVPIIAHHAYMIMKILFLLLPTMHISVYDNEDYYCPSSSSGPMMPAITPDTSQAPSTPTDQSNHLHTEPESDSDDEEVGGCSMIT